MVNHSPVKDSGAFFTIVPETRQITVPNTHKIIGVVGDHLAEQLTFEIPQTIDGHDIAGCARRYVSWLNVDGEPGTDALVELTEKPEGAKDGMLYFTWTVRNLLAAIKGLVQFSLHFEDVAEDGETRLYHWGTTTCKNCEILDSVNHALSTYAAMWVVDGTLVIEDYTPVVDGTLALESPGIIPEGTMKITEPGVYEVGLVARVDVDTTEGTLEVTENGAYDVERYKKVKVDIASELANGTIVNNSSVEILGSFYARDRENITNGVDQVSFTIAPGESYAAEDVMRYIVVIVYDSRNDYNLPVLANTKLGELTGAAQHALGVQVNDVDFSIEIINK